MKTMYVARGFVHGARSPVEAVEVVRDSEKCVWVLTRFEHEERRLKRTDSDCWFDTYAEAAAYQRSKYRNKVDHAKRRLETAEKELADIESRL